MRQIGIINNESQAVAFADYLLTLKIVTQLERQPDGWAIWVSDEDRVAAARQELQEFQQKPDDPRYLIASSTARQMRKQADQQEKEYRKKLVNVSDRWADVTTGRRPVTIALIVISIVVTLLTGFGQISNPVTYWLSFSDIIPTPDGLHFTYHGLQPIEQGQLWRLVTPIFIHLDVWHIIFDVLAMNFLGSRMEVRRGWWRMAIFVFVTAILSNMGQYFWEGPAFGGLSGVVYGLFGYVWMKTRFDPASGIYLDPFNIILLIAWFFLCWFKVFGDIANMAHTVGLAVGLVVGIAPIVWKKLTR